MPPHRHHPPGITDFMAKKAKKKKRSSADLHRQLQDSVQALPYVIADHEKQGRSVKAFTVRWIGGPMLRLMNSLMNRSRYRGDEGTKRKQTEQARRLLENKQKARQHLQKTAAKQQRRQKVR